MNGSGNPTKFGQMRLFGGNPHVELSKCNRACILLALALLINRKLHYTGGVIGYTVLRVKSVFPIEKCISF